MYKFLVTATLASAALASQYESSGQYGGSDMSSYEQGSSYEQTPSYEQSQGGYEAQPMQEEPAKEEGSKCEQGGGVATHTVLVGGDQLLYSPESIYANPGDKVWFMFLKKNHTVTQSSFDKPCVKLPGGKDSSFMPSQATVSDMSSAPKFEYVVVDKKPTWWYCRQKTGTHCGKGMTFAINPTAEKTFAMFKEEAIKQNGTAEAGGSYTPPAEQSPPPAEQAPPSYVPGSGQGSGGSCSCSCFCGVASWPAGYGIGNTGGMQGMLPMPGKVEQAPAQESQSSDYSAPAQESQPSQESSYGY